MSGREARRILGPVVAGDAQPRAALQVGPAGVALETARGRLYDDVRIRLADALPFAATYLGYVVLAADLVRLGADGPVLVPPGEWARVVTGRRLRTARGGRPAYVWTPPPD